MKKALEDTFEEIHLTLKNRLNNPIVGSYFLSFIILNWQIFLMVFSSDFKVDYKINYIKNFVHPFAPDFISYNSFKIIIFFITHPLIAPLLISLIYLFILPKIFRPLNNVILNQKIDIENDKSNAEEKLKPIQAKLKYLTENLNNETKANEAHRKQIQIYEENMEAFRKEKHLAESNYNEDRNKLKIKFMNEKDSLISDHEIAVNELNEKLNDLKNYHENQLSKSNDLTNRLNKTIEASKDQNRNLTITLQEKERLYPEQIEKLKLDLLSKNHSLSELKDSYENKIRQLNAKIIELEKSVLNQVDEVSTILEELTKKNLIEVFRLIADTITLSQLSLYSEEVENHSTDIAFFARRLLISRAHDESYGEVWLLTDLGSRVAAKID